MKMTSPEETSRTALSTGTSEEAQIGCVSPKFSVNNKPTVFELAAGVLVDCVKLKPAGTEFAKTIFVLGGDRARFIEQWASMEEVTHYVRAVIKKINCEDGGRIAYLSLALYSLLQVYRTYKTLFGDAGEHSNRWKTDQASLMRLYLVKHLTDENEESNHSVVVGTTDFYSFGYPYPEEEQKWFSSFWSESKLYVYYSKSKPLFDSVPLHSFYQVEIQDTMANVKISRATNQPTTTPQAGISPTRIVVTPTTIDCYDSSGKIRPCTSQPDWLTYLWGRFWHAHDQVGYYQWVEGSFFIK